MNGLGRPHVNTAPSCPFISPQLLPGERSPEDSQIPKDKGAKVSQHLGYCLSLRPQEGLHYEKPGGSELGGTARSPIAVSWCLAALASGKA